MKCPKCKKDMDIFPEYSIYICIKDKIMARFRWDIFRDEKSSLKINNFEIDNKLKNEEENYE